MEPDFDSAESQHFMECPVCRGWFDMRDLNAVFAHEHQLPCVPSFTFTGVEKVDQAPVFYTTLTPVNLN